ncbi:hypothetical protein CNQ36_08700 [Streptomyces fungicidicus]|uniref:Uncharacterized protein n=1 Tax=Streptomyces fungicidicus TaxID=68203 RepID=A0A494UYA6_9ACTN|nr:hypothetical protein CNQ36_08700 [Streptomyces fungicidicus]
MSRMVDGGTRGRGAGERAADDPCGARRHDRPRHRARIPGFAREGAEIGLGDAVTRLTTAVGVRPCGGCGRRAEALNRWMTIGGRDR